MLNYSFFFLPLTVRAQNVPPVLICIATKESSMRQFTSTGKPLISRTGDAGIMQLNIKTWRKTAAEHGWDFIHDEEDNISLALFIYETVGAKAWTTYGQCASKDV